MENRAINGENDTTTTTIQTATSAANTTAPTTDLNSHYKQHFQQHFASTAAAASAAGAQPLNGPPVQQSSPPQQPTITYQINPNFGIF